LAAIRPGGGDHVLHRDVPTASARDHDDIRPPGLDAHGRHDAGVRQRERRRDARSIRECGPERGLGQHLVIHDQSPQVALAGELRAMDRPVHGDGQPLAQHDAGDDLLGRLASHCLQYSSR
jgi:hypothetical protein